MRKLLAVPLAAMMAVAVTACTDTPLEVAEEEGVLRSVVLTEGIAAPPSPPGLPIALSTLENAQVSLGGSVTTPVSLNGLGCTAFPDQVVTITYSVSGNQESTAWFDINTVWTFDGSTFVGSTPITVELPAKQGGGTTTFQRSVTLKNSNAAATGTATVSVAPFNLQTNQTDPPGQRLSIDASSTATIHVAFSSCASPNTPPSLTLPTIPPVEATSSSGAVINFIVSASDAEDDDADLGVICSHDSGDTFPIGATEVECSVTDSGDLKTEDSFWVYVQDTTAPVFTAFPSNLPPLIASDINGLALDMSQFTITAADEGPDGEPGDVSGPVSIVCKVGSDDADGYQIPIAGTATVTCTASDAASYRAPGETASAPNRREQSFDVSVSLDLSTTCGFGAPLRSGAPWSGHKRNSTIPHKICAPAYADGRLATDLADGLTLALAWQSGSGGGEETMTDPAAGSTRWRWDADAQHYIFNAKTANNWAIGTWRTSVSYAGIELASTHFVLNR